MKEYRRLGDRITDQAYIGYKWGLFWILFTFACVIFGLIVKWVG